MKKYSIYIIQLLILSALTVACSEIDSISGKRTDGKIRFKAIEATDWNQTRGIGASVAKYEPTKLETKDGSPLYLHTIVDNGIQGKTSFEDVLTRGTETKVENIDYIRLVGYKYGADETFATRTGGSFCNTNVYKEGEYYTYQAYNFWPDASNKYAFFATYPNTNISTYGSSPYFTFSVQSNVTNQYDLVVASAIDQSGSSTGCDDISLEFAHVLTAVKFGVGDLTEGYTITSVGICQVSNQGTYTFGTGWTSVGNPTSSYSIGSLSWSNSSEVKGSTDNQTFYMIPQEFTESSNAYLQVTIREDNGSTYTLRKSLQGQKWEPGQTVTYLLSTSSIESLFVGNVTLRTSYNYRPVFKTTFTGSESDLTNSDKAGLFVVDVDGTTGTVAASNVMVTYNGSNWILSENLPLKSGQEYYLYYPYRENLSGAPEKNATLDYSSTMTYTRFFQDVADNWTISEDGTKDGLIANDLLVQKGSRSLNKLTFTNLNPEMCVAALTLEDKTFLTKIEGDGYQLSTDSKYKWGDFTYTYTDFPASTAFTSGMVPYNENGTYYYIVKPGVDTEISATGDNYWNLTVNVPYRSSNPNMKAYSVQTTRSVTPTDATNCQTYTLQLGDVYYDDGGLSHQSDNLRTGTMKPIGVVGYVNDGTENGNAITEKYSVASKSDFGGQIGGHGLVVSMHVLCNYGSSGLNGLDPTGIVPTNQTNLLETTFGGYGATKKITSTAGFWVNYKDSVATPKISTGWFIPSSGQFLSIFYSPGLGGLQKKEGYTYVKNETSLPCSELSEWKASIDRINTALSKTAPARGGYWPIQKGQNKNMTLQPEQTAPYTQNGSAQFYTATKSEEGNFYELTLYYNSGLRMRNSWTIYYGAEWQYRPFLAF